MLSGLIGVGLCLGLIRQGLARERVERRVSDVRGDTVEIVGSMNVTEPAFLSLSPDGRVLVSQFTGNPFAKDLLGLVSEDAASLFKNKFSGASVTTLTSNITWPNTVTWVNSSFSPNLGPHSFLICGGFLVPPKTVGAVTLVSVDESWSVESVEVLSTPEGNPLTGGWFYHEAVVMDVNGDGELDVLTARATKPLFGSSKGELVWLQRSSSPGGAWVEQVLFSGDYSPDVFFALRDLDGDGVGEVLSASYFSGGAVAVLYLVDGASTPGLWSNASAIRQVVIDTSLGTMFGLELADVNGDGKTDLLVTNHVDNTTLAGVYAYDIPTNWRSASAWKRYTLASGFPTRIPGPGQAAPGAAILVPNTSPSKIVVSGDGAEDFYLLTQSSQNSWTFAQSLLLQCNGTTGEPLVGDFDQDGTPEALLPCYDTGKIVGVKL